MHPAEGSPGDQGFDVGKHSAPLLRRMGEELAQVIEDRLDLGPGSHQLARVWGHGIVGMMHAAGDWWLGERPCSRAELVRSLADLLWGGWPRPATGWAARASDPGRTPAQPGRCQEARATWRISLR